MKSNILFVLFALLLSGCSAPQWNRMPDTGDVYLDPDYLWVNTPVQCMHEPGCSPLRSITLRAVNLRYLNVWITVRCERDDGSEFGTGEIAVAARDDAVFMVYGMARTVPDSDSVSCSIVGLR